MSDEEDKEKLRPVFIMVPRKLVIGWITTFLCVIVAASATIQWANYVDQRSNQRWCSLFNMYTTEYKENPPPTTLGQNIAFEINRMRNDWCK